MRKVPLATAQRLMRHSDPKLTVNIYTHVLLDENVEALAKLPIIAAYRPASESAAKTGTDNRTATGENSVVMESHDNEKYAGNANEADGRSVVMRIGSFGTDAMNKIKTYMDNEDAAKATAFTVTKIEKNPVP